jgi:Tol biopolymer transport system component
MHRFHSSSPFSPSGRYLALTRLAQEDRGPRPGEVAEIVIVDLQTGETRTVADTRGWDSQLGAQAQWGADDTQLFFNDVDTSTWTPFGVKMNILTGDTKKLGGTVYMISPDGKWAASACLKRIGTTQKGYGVVVPENEVQLNNGAPENNGVYITNTTTGECRMVASYARIVSEAIPRIDVKRYGPGDFYGFHVKWNAQSDRIMLVLRYWVRELQKGKPQLLTMTRDGEDIRLAIANTLWADLGGNHPNWCPDGRHVMMNLWVGGRMRFVQAAYDGSGLRKLTDVEGTGGHPTLHPNGKFIITDDYAASQTGPGDGTAPLLHIDLVKHEPRQLVRIEAVTKDFKSSNGRDARNMRVDLHPAWNRQYTHVAFNGVQDGTRRVHIADLTSLIR